MAVRASTPIELIRSVYATLAERIGAAGLVSGGR